ncbi:unnamed protein product [Zymoseptoria tritici ST99CH_1A5]|uniref:HMG box domain-containing protein n=3 Tax=Zymoseptoria tritici TaxID=1047171 RepID=A0A2H1GAY8_ZYMTR|nr:unnamed protein product [Zymoseptoria tritici ST99CH_1E4]SMY23404.1 unnamed protein product [Zymoseptoria tritici ST99CH_1A5]
MPAPLAHAHSGDIVQIAVSRQAFVHTRNALNNAFMSLSSAIDRAVKAYADHTEVVLAGDGSLDVSSLLQPFNSINQFAQQFPPAFLGQYGAPVESAAPVAPMSADGVKQPKQKRQYKQRDMNAPKRPLTAYFRYLREQRPILTREMAENPDTEGTKAGDISKLATERWKALTDAEREPYKQAYQKELLKYETDTKAYKESLKADGLKPADDDAEGEEDEFEDAVAAPPVVARADDSTDSGSSSSDDDSDEESESEEEAPVKAPSPPPKKKAKSAGPKKITAGPDPTPAQQPQMFSSMNPPQPSTAPVESAKKRKAAADGDEGSTKKKRGRPTKADKAASDAAAAAAQLNGEAATPGAEKKSKKEKKRKSEAAA